MSAALNEPYEPEWHRIAREWQDPGDGWALAALASNAWVPPLSEQQRIDLIDAATTITDADERHEFLVWLGLEARLS